MINKTDDYTLFDKLSTFARQEHIINKLGEMQFCSFIIK